MHTGACDHSRCDKSTDLLRAENARLTQQNERLNRLIVSLLNLGLKQKVSSLMMLREHRREALAPVPRRAEPGDTEEPVLPVMEQQIDDELRELISLYNPDLISDDGETPGAGGKDKKET